MIPPGDQKIIAGDIDNSSNSAALSPAVATFVNANPVLKNTFIDFPDLQQTKTIYAFIDLNADNKADIVAGFPFEATVDPNVPAKVYQVALADNTNPNNPQFGPPLDRRFWGNVYLMNDPAHPNLEFQVANFRELFAAFNSGRVPAKTDTISVGVEANQVNNPVLNGTFINLKPVPLNEATLPDQCPDTPPIKINPHQNAHVNTAHPTDVQVVVYGSANFDVNKIVTNTVTLGGATPLYAAPARRINNDAYPDKVFDFRGSDIKLPPGYVDAVVSGELTDFNSFTNTVRIFNRDASFYTPHDLASQAARQAAQGPIALLTPNQRKFLGIKSSNVTDAAIQQLQQGPDGLLGNRKPVATDTGAVSSPVVSIPVSGGGLVTEPPTPVVSIPTASGKSVVQPKRLKVVTAHSR